MSVAAGESRINNFKVKKKKTIILHKVLYHKNGKIRFLWPHNNGKIDCIFQLQYS